MATAEQRNSATKAIASEVFAFFRKFPSMRKGNVRLVIRRRSRLSFLRSVNFREEKERNRGFFFLPQREEDVRRYFVRVRIFLELP